MDPIRRRLVRLAPRGGLTAVSVEPPGAGDRPFERLVSTEVYEGISDADANAALDTLTLAEDGDRTLMTLLVEHPTKEGRDAHINSGMEDGMQDAMDLLEEVAISLG